jgi:hypothetical protein
VLLVRVSDATVGGRRCYCRLVELLPAELPAVLLAGATMLPAELWAVLSVVVSSERKERAITQWALSKENKGGRRSLVHVFSCGCGHVSHARPEGSEAPIPRGTLRISLLLMTEIPTQACAFLSFLSFQSSQAVTSSNVTSPFRRLPSDLEMVHHYSSR